MSQIASYRERNWLNISQENEILSFFKKQEEHMETTTGVLCCSWVVTGIASTQNSITYHAVCRFWLQPRVPDDHIQTSASLVCFSENRNLNLPRLHRITKKKTIQKSQHR